MNNDNKELEIKARVHAAELKGLKCLTIFEELIRNPNNDPFYATTAQLLEENPDKQEKILLNFIDALSVANLRFAHRLREAAQSHDETLNAMGSSNVVPAEHNVTRRGRGSLVKGFVKQIPGMGGK